jgi:DNA (cytosine-5)-methyltransferase 1
MRTLHLFAGAGGGLLADLILGHTPVAAVEWDAYCCQVLRERANEGWFPGLRVHEGDVRLFDPSEYAGRVDCIHAGFPCQDISHAGNRAGIQEGTRSGLWSEVIRIARIVRPSVLFLENVAAIVNLRPGLDIVLADLAELGFDARWICLRASDAGAPHRRDRWWCLATNTDAGMRDGRADESQRGSQGRVAADRIREDVSNADQRRQQVERLEEHGNGFGLTLGNAVKIPTPSANDWKGSSKDGQRRGQLTDPAMGVIPAGGSLNPTWVEWLMAFPLGYTVARAHESRRKKSSKKAGAEGDTDVGVLPVRLDGQVAEASPESQPCAASLDPVPAVSSQGAQVGADNLGPARSGEQVGESQQAAEVRMLRGDVHLQAGEGNDVQSVMRQYAGAAPSWWEVEPDLGRVAHGIPNRVDRLKALGNGQVPLQAALAWRILTS